MNLENLLKQLRSLGISLAIKDKKLLCSDPNKKLSNKLRSQVREHKDDLLVLLYNKTNGKSPNNVKPNGYRELAPVSSQQRRIYALQQFDLSNTAYNMPAAYILKSNFDERRFKKAIESLTERHFALRTTFEIIDGEVLQRIHANRKCSVAFEKLSDFDAEKAAIAAFFKPFDLGAGPLFRIRALGKPNGETILLTDMHHIISDGVSNNILIGDFAALYQGNDLPEISLQYIDYAIWQQDGPGCETIASQSDYWAGQFETRPTILELPTDFARPKIRAFAGALYKTELPNDTLKKLNAYSKNHGVTLFMTLFACYSTLLSRLSGQSDITVGTSVAGRIDKELERTLGVFINTLALRSFPDGSKRFSDYLLEVKRICLGGFEHQLYPFEQLVDSIDLPRDPSRNPIFDTMFIMQNFDRSSRVDELGLIRPYPLEGSVAKFDLTLTVTETKDGMELLFEYATNLFKEKTVQRFSDSLNRIITQIASGFDSSIAEIEALSKSEKHQLLIEYRGLKESYSNTNSIQQSFDLQVAKNPDSPAALFGEETLSYKQLNQLSNQLARKLKNDFNVGVGAIVGLISERSTDMLVGMLAILKAGGSYLPIDPSYPEERIQYMLKDSACRVLLGQTRRIEKLDFGGGVTALDDRAALSSFSVENLSHANSPNDLAYVIYTSGSTGKPKGVMIEHRNVLNFALGMLKAVELSNRRRIVSATTICFDIFVLESLVPLMTGMSVAIASEDEQHDPFALNQLIKRTGADIFQATPSLMKVLFDTEGSSETLNDVRAFIVGGEAFPESLFDSMRKKTNADIYNLYGPTETTVWSTSAKVESKPIVIGRPIVNTQIHIVDKDSVLLPIGVIGELCIAGDGLARGYLNRPELTAQKFVPNPFALGERMYRTGDLARWLPNGELECLGRIDGQVKIRGHRIELGEIEAIINQQENVGECVVTTRSIQGNDALVAYFTSDCELDIQTLRECLSRPLPSYMIPSHFVRLPALPLTANGKVDRKALPDPAGNTFARNNYTPPRNEIERALTSIWEKELAVKRVGIHDDFFDLGGDSLIMIRIVANAKKAGINLLVKDILQLPTIAGLSSLDLLQKTDTESESPTGPIALTPMHLQFLESAILKRYVIPLRFRLNQRIEFAQLQAAIVYLLSHHDGLRTRFTKNADGWTGVIPEPDETFAETMVLHEDVSKYSESKQSEIIDRNWHGNRSSLDFTRGENLKCVLYERGHERPQQLQLFVHHLVVDWEAIRIILEDLSRLCQQALSARALQLSPKTAPVRQIFQCLDAAGRSEALHQELPYWNAIPWETINRIPFDFDTTEASNNYASTRQYETELPAELTKSLQDGLPQLGANMLDAILAGLTSAVCEFTYSERMMARTGSANAIVSTYAGHLNASRTVAWFTAGKMLVLPKSDHTDPIERMITIKKAADSVPNQGLGFDLLKYKSSQPDVRDHFTRVSNRDIIFNYLGKADDTPRGKSAIEPIEARPGERIHDSTYTCQRDLTFFIEFRVANEKLMIRCDYSSNLHKESTIEQFLGNIVAELKNLALACRPALAIDEMR